ncbi:MULTISPECIES: hypothetical protein [Pseudomonas]|uniref:hypothetical protein n=1 Tax=Pseudomonas TaxID=286 RepID=UPI001F143258|nr:MULTISPECIES: hypothetical protein [Pseudomonas]
MTEHNPIGQQPAAQTAPMPSMVWEPANTRHTGGESLRLGKYIVGEWQTDATLPKGAKSTHAVTCRLPGVRPALGHCETSANARALLEKVVKSWISQAGLFLTAPTTERNESGVCA